MPILSSAPMRKRETRSSRRMTSVMVMLIGLMFGLGIVPASSAKVKMLLARSSGPYEQVKLAIQKSAGFDLETFVMAGKSSVDQEVIGGFSPGTTDLVLAVGSQAVNPARKLDSRIPLVYTMVFDPVNFEPRQASGVILQISIQEQLARLRKMFPQRKRIGVLFNPNYSRAQINEARRLVGHYDFNLFALPVVKTSEVPAALERLGEGSVDILWMIADQTVVHPNSVKLLVEHSLDTKVPLIGLSLFHVKHNALAAFSVDFDDIGKQTAALIRKTLDSSGGPVVEQPRKIVIFVNKKVKDQMKIRDLAELPEITYIQ